MSLKQAFDLSGRMAIATRDTLDRFGEKIKVASPLHRLGDDEDLEGAAPLFCSDAGKHITGQIPAVNGGVSAVR